MALLHAAGEETFTIPLDRLLLTPFMVRRWSRPQREYRVNRAEIVGVGVMMPATYLPCCPRSESRL